MTNLEKVIKAVDICRDVTGCTKCPYYDRKHKIMACMDRNLGRNKMLDEVAFYLKKYLLCRGDENEDECNE